MTLVFAGAPNRADEAVLTAGTEEPALPAANLQDRQIVRPWRTQGVDPADTWLALDFQVNRTVGAVALVRHNFSQGSTWRIRAGDDATFQNVKYDSGPLEVWPDIEEFGTQPWGIFQWGGLLPEEVAETITLSAYHLLPQQTVARYVRIDLADPANPAGYLQAGRLLVGPYYRPSRHFLYGWSMGYEDPSEVSKSRGGQTWVDVQERYRVLRFSVANLNEREAFDNIFDHLLRRRGVSGDVLVIPQSDKPELFHHQAVYGRLRTLEPIANPFFESFETSFEVEELI